MHWLRITFVFILILFIDSVNRVYRVQLEVLAATEQSSKGGAYVFDLIPACSPNATLVVVKDGFGLTNM
jgi:hypothetical protein